MIDQPWTDDPSILLQQQVLLTLAETDDTQAVDIAHTLNTGPDEIAAAFRDLIAQGLAAGFNARAGGGDPGATITSAGAAKVRQWAALRKRGRLKKACAAALLSWLDDLDEEPVGSTEDFLRDVRAHYYATRFTNFIVTEAAHDLHRKRLIAGRATLGTVLQPAITGLGRAVHTQHAGDFTAYEASHAAARAGATVNYITATNANVATNSPGAQQTITINTEPRELVLAIADALRHLQANEPSIDTDQANTLASQLQDAADETDTHSGRRRARGLVHQVQALIINATGGAGGQALYELAAQAIQQLA